MAPTDSTQPTPAPDSPAAAPVDNDASKHAADLSAFAAMTEKLSGFPIEVLEEKHLLPCTTAELEEFLRYLWVCGLTLKAKAEIAHKIVDFRARCVEKARRFLKLEAAEVDAILGASPAEEAAEVRKAMDELAKGPVPEASDKPATQHLIGSHITSDVAVEVKPGN